MKKATFRHQILLVVVIATGCSKDGVPEDAVLHAVHDRHQLHRVNDTPYPMADETIAYCVDVFSREHREYHRTRGTLAYCFVYSNESGEETILSGKGLYPVGSILMKEKLPTPASRDPELFTVMRKREPGYDSEHGDWEYSVVSGDGRTILEKGKLQSCIGCHQEYRDTDYVTRTYLDTKSTLSIRHGSLIRRHSQPSHE